MADDLEDTGRLQPANEPENEPMQATVPNQATTPTTQPVSTLGQVATTEDEDLEAQLTYESLKRQRESKKRRRIVIIAVAAVAALVAIVAFIIPNANQAATDDGGASELVTTMVYQGDFATTVTANGATQPLRSTVVTPEVDGIIEDLQVEEGSYVNEGDVLFILKNERLDKEVRDAQNEVTKAQNTIGTASQAVDDAYAAYNEAANAVTSIDDDYATFDEASLRSAITSAEAAYQDAVANLSATQENLQEKQAEADKRTVRAPVSGTVVVMNAQNGAAVGGASGGTTTNSTSSGNLIEIADLSKMQVTVQVNEIDIASIAAGQEAKATFAALPDLTLAATVQRIATESTGSSDGMGGGGVVTYAVNLLIPDPDPRLKPGMTATVNITTQSLPNTLIVQTAALMEDFDQDSSPTYSVIVVDDIEKGTTHVVPVEVLMQNTSEAAIKGDLQDGDIVVLSGGAGAGGDVAMDATTAEMAG